MGEPVFAQRYLDTLYQRYNRREYIHPDPLELVYRYDNLGDREIAAFIAASLAYGRVHQILKSVSSVLDVMVPGPSTYLKDHTRHTIFRTFCGFKHRFTDGRKLSSMLCGLRQMLITYGSLKTCFGVGMADDEDTLLNASAAFAVELTRCAEEPLDHLVSSPHKGSACKRLNLFLRWMVRCDDVDPGGWSGVPPSKLLVPLDVHMHRIARFMNLTRRRQANMKTVMEVTKRFRMIDPSDPVKYDFCLTRLGIRGGRQGLGGAVPATN